MAAIEDGVIALYWLFDVAEAIRLEAIPRFFEGQTASAQLLPKPATPAYTKYRTPPLVLQGEALQQPEIEAFRVRLKIFDYGVVSVALSRPFQGTWGELVALGADLMDSDALARKAEDCVRRLASRIATAIDSIRERYLVEDYIVFAVTALQPRLSSEQLIEQHGEDIAHLLRGERAGLSTQEREEVLRHRISYLVDDLIIPSWNAAFVYDTPAGLDAALEIFEYANSQLLEFRYYDGLLDTELSRIYADLQRPRWYDVMGRRRTQAAHQLHALFIDVNELTDKMENALKLVGDVYAARLYGLVAARLGLDRWKQNVEEKLETLDDIFRFAVEQLQVARGHLLELTIILILVLELVLVFMGIMT